MTSRVTYIYFTIKLPVCAGGTSGGGFWNNTLVPNEAINIMESLGYSREWWEEYPPTIWPSGKYEFAAGSAFFYDPNLRILDSVELGIYADYGGDPQKWFFDEKGNLVGTWTMDWELGPSCDGTCWDYM